jgi:beta-lactamase superfamily II metal-dependent hydrolase
VSHGAVSVTPNRLAVRMYQVGFGDCFLLSFRYPTPLPDGRTERHMLIDMGSNHPPTGRKLAFGDVAKDIALRVGKNLDVVVLSHRHKDHLAGFGDDAAVGVLQALQHGLIVRAWTEDPAKQDDPTVKALRNTETISAAVATGASASGGHGHRAELAAAAERQTGNNKAIQQLNTWADRAAAEYLSFGLHTRIPEFVPGIKVHVLGPPLPADAPDVIRERSWYDDQYWLTQLGALAEADPVSVADGAPVATPGADVPAGPIRWLVENLAAQHTASAMRLIHEFDKAMNNTSVILLIEAGTKRLLFGGDAQWESWDYALSNAPRPKRDVYLPLLRTLDLYKVGHHGSLNATPKQSLFGLWEPAAAKQRGMVALISTCCGVYPGGKPVPPETPTRVPRLTLVDALQDVTALYSTTDLGDADLFLEVAADLTTATPFKVTAPASLKVQRRDLCAGS